MNRSPHPVGTVCPKCGSALHKKVDPDWQPAIVNDRVCLGCGTRYSPAPPAYLGVVVMVLSIACAVFGCIFLFRYFFEHDAVVVSPKISVVMIVIGVIAPTIWLARPRGGQ